MVQRTRERVCDDWLALRFLAPSITRPTTGRLSLVCSARRPQPEQTSSTILSPIDGSSRARPPLIARDARKGERPGRLARCHERALTGCASCVNCVSKTPRSANSAQDSSAPTLLASGMSLAHCSKVRCSPSGSGGRACLTNGAARASARACLRSPSAAHFRTDVQPRAA